MTPARLRRLKPERHTTAADLVIYADALGVTLAHDSTPETAATAATTEAPAKVAAPARDVLVTGENGTVGYMSAADLHDLTMAESLCLRYACGAPCNALTEACIRVAGFMLQTRRAAIHVAARLKLSGVDLPLIPDAPHGDPVRRSGAAAVLRTWRRRTITTAADDD